ncbi:hypothetical protein HKX48_009346 [Thoreauomyces humboldtii]|nr:hypothetical protein HKX48_009346 [Thoreauomyces humboldtii]
MKLSLLILSAGLASPFLLTVASPVPEAGTASAAVVETASVSDSSEVAVADDNTDGVDDAGWGGKGWGGYGGYGKGGWGGYGGYGKKGGYYLATRDDDASDGGWGGKGWGGYGGYGKGRWGGYGGYGKKGGYYLATRDENASNVAVADDDSFDDAGWGGKGEWGGYGGYGKGGWGGYGGYGKGGWGGYGKKAGLVTFVGLPAFLAYAYSWTKRQSSPSALPSSLVAPATKKLQPEKQGARTVTKSVTQPIHSREPELSVGESQPASRPAEQPAAAPPSPAMLRPEPRTSLLQKHKLLAEHAFKLTTAGLDFDDAGDTKAALRKYQEGAQAFKDAIGLSLPNASERLKAEPLNQKMRGNLEIIEDRINRIEDQEMATRMPAKATKSASTRPSGRKTPSSVASTGARPRSGKSASAEPVAAAKPSLRNVDKTMADRILNEVVVNRPGIKWDDIVGLDGAKAALHEIVILPTLRPELFTGLRSPAKGVLLFGPPGTGKTMCAQAVAGESKATFFSISASTLTSKYVGEGEKMVRTLFEMARQLQPSVIFIDEIDSIMTARSDSEHEASRRLKTEFLLQFDGLGTNPKDRLLVLAATNRPQELDEAALRRLVKRIYIPLPEPPTRKALIESLLRGHKHSLAGSGITQVVRLTEGYSGSDMAALAREAALGPIRELGRKLVSTPAEDIRPISLNDFVTALRVIRPSVSPGSLKQYLDWNKNYGTDGT